MRIATVTLTAWLLGCGTAVNQAPSINLADLPADVTLAVGESRAIGNVKLQFSAVLSDSRCPSDVVCVWAGNAEIELIAGPTVGYGPSERVTVNTTLEPKFVTARGLTLSVLDLSPTPVSTQPTKNYRVVLRVDRVR